MLAFVGGAIVLPLSRGDAPPRPPQYEVLRCKQRGMLFLLTPIPVVEQRRIKITPTPPSPVEGEGYREGGIFV